MRYEKTHVRIDDATIADGDPSAIIEPVWFTANIYAGPVVYEVSLRSFSRAQRYVFALRWYIAEVNNGGHDQFYSNSTGIVWRDALEACKLIGAYEIAEILQQSANRFGGSPSQVHEERLLQLKEFAPDFNDLDDRFFEIQPDAGVDDRLITFIRTRPSDFYFEGMVDLPVFPGN